MTLMEAQTGKEYTIKAIETQDEEMDAFCFLWGATPGRPSR